MSANRWRGFHPVGNRCLAKSLWPTQPTSVQRVVWCWQEDEEQASFKCVWTFILRNSCRVKHNSQNLSMDQFLYAIIIQWNVLEGIYVVFFWFRGLKICVPYLQYGIKQETDLSLLSDNWMANLQKELNQHQITISLYTRWTFAALLLLLHSWFASQRNYAEILETVIERTRRVCGLTQ